MTAVAVSLGRVQARSVGLRVPRPTPGRLAFLLYLGIGAYLALVLHAYHGDAYSRVANAYYVLFSRDPHLAAIGFVWTPLPSLFELVLLPVKVIWPELTKMGVAAVVMSATFMALAVAEVNVILADFKLRRRTRLALVAAFALNPAIVYYGAIGTSEAPTLFFTLLACRHLSRYAASASTVSLVGVGIALAGAFLTRYEAIPAAAGVAAMILLVSLLRVPGTTRQRLAAAGADIAVAIMPVLLVFLGWSLASWIIIGSPFSQFTSEYGNSSQMQVWAAEGANEIGLPLGPSIVLAGLRLAALSVVVPIALVLALRRLFVGRDYRVLAIGAVLGPLLAFMVLMYVFHVLAPWLRYFITVIPLGILLVGLTVAPAGSAPASGQPRLEWRAGLAPRAGLIRRIRASFAWARSAAHAAIERTRALIARVQPAARPALEWTRARLDSTRAALITMARWFARSTRATTLAVVLWAAVLADRLALHIPAGRPSRLFGSRAIGRLIATGRSISVRRSIRIGAVLVRRSIPPQTRRNARRLAATTPVKMQAAATIATRAARAGAGAMLARFRGAALVVTSALVAQSLALGGRAGSQLRALRRGVTAAAVSLRPRVSRLAPGVVLALALASVPVTGFGLLQPAVAVEESRDIGALLGPNAAAPDRPGAAVRTFAVEQAVARYLDDLDLPRGAVLMDVFSGFPIVLLSDHPEQFVITTDSDFKQILADPPTFGVEYLLVPAIQGHGVLDAVNRAYPDLALREGFASVARRFPAMGTSSSWTLYRLDAAASAGSR